MNIPSEIKNILPILKNAGYDAYIVGGCVRDLLRATEPQDWDLTSNAAPQEIEAIFNKAGYKTFYENAFGTVSVITDSENERLKTIEITPFRVESKYTDKRHPDKVEFAKTLQDDLSRRDFTINAIAANVTLRRKEKGLGRDSSPTVQNDKIKVIDPFGGQKDLENKIIRAVGEPKERFQEDALRLMRAVRFATTLTTGEIWQIEAKTKKAIIENSRLLKQISQERIRDELVKIIMSPNASEGIELLRELGLLSYIIPELEEGFAIDQSKHHIYDIYQHNILSLKYACEQNYSLEARLASLLHDIAKPRTKRGIGQNSTFYNHEIVGAKMSYQILRRLRFPKKIIDKVVKLVRFHLFYYNVDEVGASSVRRLVKNVGAENMEELLQLRKADRIGSGVPKAEPYKLRHLKYLVEKVSKDPLSAKMLKINGADIMKILDIKPGPKVGQVLSYLLSYVLSYPKKNDREFLESEVKRLGAMSDKDLQDLANKAKTETEKVEQKRDNMTKSKYWVT